MDKKLFKALNRNNNYIVIEAKDENEAIDLYLDLIMQGHELIGLYELDKWNNLSNQVPQEKIMLRERKDITSTTKLDSINGYSIISVMDMNNGGDEIVVGYEPTQEKPYATWLRSTEAEGYVYFEGNFFTNLIDASKDQLERCSKYCVNFAFDRYKELISQEKNLMYRYLAYYGAEAVFNMKTESELIENVGDLAYQYWIDSNTSRSVDDIALFIANGINDNYFMFDDLKIFHYEDLYNAIELDDYSQLNKVDGKELV